MKTLTVPVYFDFSWFYFCCMSISTAGRSEGRRSLRALIPQLGQRAHAIGRRPPSEQPRARSTRGLCNRGKRSARSFYSHFKLLSACAPHLLSKSFLPFVNFFFFTLLNPFNSIMLFSLFTRCQPKAALEPSNREYADAAADTKRQFTHAPPQPPPQQQQGYGQQQQQRGGGGGPMNIFADGMAWCVANQQMLLQGGLALFAVW